jgi:hypothetical protein
MTSSAPEQKPLYWQKELVGPMGADGGTAGNEDWFWREF